MLVLAAHKSQHVGPALLGLLTFFGSLALGLYLLVIFRGKLHRTVAALAALSLATVSFGWLRTESDTWWKRRCERPHYIKAGCGDEPPLVPFTVSPQD